MAHLFDSVQIHRFRGLADLKLDGLGRVNLLVGDNNSGKTSVLEALGIFCDPLNPWVWLQASQRRFSQRAMTTGLQLDAMRWLFPSVGLRSDQEATRAKISISAVGASSIRNVEAEWLEIERVALDSDDVQNRAYLQPNRPVSPSELQVLGEENIAETKVGYETEMVERGGELKVMVEPASVQQLSLMPETSITEVESYVFWPSSRFARFPRRRRQPWAELNNSVILARDSDYRDLSVSWSDAVAQGLKSEVISLLQFFDPDVLDVDLLAPFAVTSTIYVSHRRHGLAPIYTFGDGFRRVLSIAASLAAARNGVLLIDEIETAIHASMLERTFSWLMRSCTALNVQIVATTHSLEAVDAILAAEEKHDEIVGYRLRANTELPKRFAGELLYRLRYDRGLDPR